MEYYVAPELLKPGFEKRLSGKSLLGIYVAFAAGLSAPGLIRARKAPDQPSTDG
jgi:hypothetical protein